METARIDKDIFPGLMLPPFHYTCFTRFTGYSEDRYHAAHNCFQVILGLSGVLHFEIEGEKRVVSQRAGDVFVLGPGIRHRWHSEEGGHCENFMFFCDGFGEDDSDLGRMLTLGGSDVIWNFTLVPETYAFYVDNFRELIRRHDCCTVNQMHGLLYAFCALICRRANRLYRPPTPEGRHPSLSRAIELINRDYRGKISLGKLSRQCALSPSRLSELFRESLGLSPMQYHNQLRIDKARQLLRHSDMNVTQIAEYLGFSSVHYFSRFFKTHTGLAPSAAAAEEA
jgi:AraC-like DNA-binding protein